MISLEPFLLVPFWGLHLQKEAPPKAPPLILSSFSSVQFSSLVVSDSATPWTAARQASLSITSSRSLLRLKSYLFQKGLPDHLSPQRTFPSLTAIALTVFAICFTNSLFTVMYSFPILSFLLMLPLQVDCIHSIFCFWSGLTLLSHFGIRMSLCLFSDTNDAAGHRKQFYLCVVQGQQAALLLTQIPRYSLHRFRMNSLGWTSGICIWKKTLLIHKVWEPMI